jgi:hypothetical protein
MNQKGHATKGRISENKKKNLNGVNWLLPCRFHLLYNNFSVINEWAFFKANTCGNVNRCSSNSQVYVAAIMVY